jgi:LysM repeat protein
MDGNLDRRQDVRRIESVLTWVRMQTVMPEEEVSSVKAVARRREVAIWKRALIALFGVSAALATLPVLLLLSAYFYFLITGTILPGVQVGGIPMQGLSATQAAAVLDQVWNGEYRISVIDMADSSLAWEVAPSDFGLSVDAQASAELAYARGRGAGVISGVIQMIETWLNGWPIQPWVTFDALAARRAIESWAAQLRIEAIDADLYLQEGEVVQVDSQQGRSLDVEATYALISADPTSLLLRYHFAPLVLNPVEAGTADVAQAAGEAERLLGSQPSVRAYDPVTDEWFDWTPSRAEISSWLRIERTQDEVVVSLDGERVAAYVTALNASLGEERSFDFDAGLAAANLELQGGESETLLIHYNPTSYVVQRGDTITSISLQIGMPYWKIYEYNPQEAVRGIQVGSPIVIPPKDAMLDLPVVMSKRIVISISQQRMWVYEDGALIWEHVVSTGIPSSPTMAGIFQIKSHYINAYASRWDLYMPHFMGIYDATPYLENGIHGLPLLSSGVRLWGNVLGRPASYGCIILTLQAAEDLYEWADLGVIVEIQR